MSTILIVEDHAMSREALKALLGYYGHKLLEAADGAIALKLAQAEHPDLIITDIVMPTMDGIEFVRQLRAEKKLKKTPVIFYTATYRIREARKMVEGFGGCHVIPKPSEPSVILQSVNEILGTTPSEAALPPVTGAPFAASKYDPFRCSGIQLAMLIDLGYHLLSQRDPSRLLEIFCSAASSLLNCRYIGLTLLEDNGQKRHFGECRTDKPVDALHCGLLSEVEIMEHVVSGRRTLRRNKGYGDTGKKKRGRGPSFESLMAIPFATPDNVYGWFCLADKTEHTPFNEQDEEMAGALSAQAALAYENILLLKNIKQLNEELSARNTELEAFIYSVSHDLRAPLRTITGFAEALIEDYGGRLDEQGRDYLARIHKGAGNMGGLIDDLLRLSKVSRQGLGRTNINLSDMAASIIAELRVSGPGRSVEIFIAEGLTAFADRQLMEIVLSNLLGNAWKFTSKTGQARIEFGSRQQDGETVYYVKDNGSGFDSTHADKMFRPFNRLHSEKEFEGTGIGLAIVERIISRHGGKVWAEGEVGKGATVWFTIPASS